jgi:arsenate reductase (glutaredoxin)
MSRRFSLIRIQDNKLEFPRYFHITYNAIMTNILYGIPNCDSVKKTRAFLTERGVAYTFHDYKKHGVPEAALRMWVSAKGWETVLNQKGTTWRELDEATKAKVINAEAAIAVMLANPSAIKRPVVISGETIIVGVDFEALAKVET